MSEKLIVSHYENNYGGAVKRLNLIVEQLAGLDFNTTPGFVINGLKREELIASNSMILHELFFDGLGDESAPGKELAGALTRDFGSVERWRAEFIAMGKALAGGSGWCCYLGRRAIAGWSTSGLPTTATHWRWPADRCPRYVRALLSHRLRRQGRDLRRHLHERQSAGATPTACSLSMPRCREAPSCASFLAIASLFVVVTGVPVMAQDVNFDANTAGSPPRGGCLR